ncbi:HD-GYP domain-containing protein [Maridesulfovibrio zosterae]|uniref:HD-GYP domain-containing protein n=1 Tax=Maridesulfovibrio zosterae TaxID=82171 RepID=UPI00040F1C06|nr:HD-GYP domain-containing protein [Maridesulfovibrio zosterae]
MLKKVSVKRLKVGLHIHLKDIPWFKHSFFRSNFKIKKSQEIDEVQGIGCEYVYYDPQRSDCEPLQVDAKVKPVSKTVNRRDIKKKKSSELRKRKDAYINTEKKFLSSAKQANRIMRGVLNGQISFCEEAQEMAHEFASFFLKDIHTTLNLINLSASDDEALYFHSLNVSILSCMLGREVGINDSDMHTLAFGALMHDIGKAKIPKKILYKPSVLTKPELEMVKRHPLYGVGLLSGMKSVNKDVMKIIYHHHVRNGPSGYPEGISFKSIGLLPKIVAIVDLYDNLINHRVVEKVLTPHQALANLYKSNAKLLDEKILAHFIRMLGVYPPGSLCELDSGEIAMVVSIGDNPLLPDVIIYDQNIPKNEAMILRLGADIDSKVERIVSRKDLTEDQLQYLSPKSKIGYYVDSKSN